MKRHLLTTAAILGLLGLSGIAEAQTGITGAAVPIPQVTSYGPNDLIKIIPRGYTQAGNQYITTTNLLGSGGTPGSVPIYVSVATISATPSPTTERAIRGEMSVGVSISGSSTYNLVGTRGGVTVPSGITVNDYSTYLYGLQGKLIVGGTLTASNSYGLVGQWDISTATLASSGNSMAVIWGDAGASSSASANSNLPTNDSSMLRLTNTTSAKTASISEIIADSALFMVLGINGGGLPSYVATAGTGGTSCGVSTGAVAAKVIHITVNSVDYWIPLCSSNS